MTGLIIILVILLIVAPLFALLPSKRQKQQLKFRQQAMSLGISVELTRIDDPMPKQEKYISNTGRQLETVLPVVAYRIHRPEPAAWRQEPDVNWSIEQRSESEDGNLPGTWCWQNPPENLTPVFSAYLKDELGHLPIDAVRIDEVNRVVSVYWQELSGESGLQSIIGFLKGCIAIRAAPEEDS